MSKLDDINTLVRLLKEFEFPVSPILEYSIQEKINQLSSEGESPVPVPAIRVQKNDWTKEVSVKTKKITKQKPSVIRVIRTNGTVIQCARAADTFCQTIKEIGADKVYNLYIPMDGMHIVTVGGNPNYPKDQHDVGYGYFVNVHSSTYRKKLQLETIFKALNIAWKVEIVEYGK